MLQLENKVVLITGATRGIGLETARVFLKNKAKVIILGSKQESVVKAINILSDEGHTVEGFFPDLSNYDEVETLVNYIITNYGTIDVLINNAGVSAHKKIENTSVEEFTNTMNLNVNAIFNMVKAVVPHMKERRQGVILNTSSMVSFHGQPAGLAYPTSKSAVNGLTKSLARELAPFNIRVNAVAPGITKTDMVASLPQEMIENLIKTIPLGRMGEPRDIANAFLFLASPMASYISGIVLQVDGLATN